MTSPRDLDPVPLPIWWREEYGDPTREFDIDKMPAGREMDALIAELMGWKREGDGLYPWHMKPPKGQGVWYARIVPHYSTMIVPAWEVVEWLGKQTGSVIVELDYDGFYVRCKPSGENSLGDTAPLAICRCAWKVRRNTKEN